jgi:hypothetical protein
VYRVPSAAQCWQEKGEGLRGLGRLSEARDAYRRAVQTADGDNTWVGKVAQQNLARVEAALARKAREVPGIRITHHSDGSSDITLTGPISEQTVAAFNRAFAKPQTLEERVEAAPEPHAAPLPLIQNGNLFDAETHKYLGPAPPSFDGPEVLFPDSRGGSVSAAMAIGDAVRKTDLTVIVGPDDECSSACVLILAAGVQRRVVGRIGIHRPSFQDDSGFGSLKGEEAATAYRQMSDKVREYLRRMGFEDGLYAAMLRVPSGEARYLTPSEVKDFGLEGDDPAFAEWMKARAIERQGREGYEVDQSFFAVFDACLNSGIDQSQCGRDTRSKFNSDLEQCAAANGGARTQCAREVGRRMSEAYRH